METWFSINATNLPPRVATALKLCISHPVSGHGAACLMNSPLMDFDDGCKRRKHHAGEKEKKRPVDERDSTCLLRKMRMVLLFFMPPEKKKETN